MENETIVTEENYKKFIRNHSKTSMIIIRVCYIILYVFGLLSLLILFDPEAESFDVIYSVYCLTLAVLFMLFDIFYVKINLKSSKTKNLLNSTYKYFFDETSLSVSVFKEEKLMTETKMNYSMIYKVVFFENYIYIYLNRINAYIVAKEGFKTEQDYLNIVNALKPFENNKQRQKNF